MQALGRKLIAYNYDFKQLVRDICNSHAYQRSGERNSSNEHDERNFAHARARRIQAEMLLDCITEVTETKNKFPGLPLGAKAVQIADGAASTYFLTTFGRSPRETVCAAEVRMEPTLSQALHLINGDTIRDKISSGGVIRRMLDAKRGPRKSSRRSTFAHSREPAADETERLLKLIAADKNPQAALEDIFWALLNSREFAFNH